MARGALPGERRGGRRPGSRNRINRAVDEKLAKLGCDPIEGMATIAMDPASPIEIRAKLLIELAQYIAPKRRAVEHTLDPPGAAGGIIVQITGDDANLYSGRRQRVRCRPAGCTARG